MDYIQFLRDTESHITLSYTKGGKHPKLIFMEVFSPEWSDWYKSNEEIMEGVKARIAKHIRPQTLHKSVDFWISDKEKPKALRVKIGIDWKKDEKEQETEIKDKLNSVFTEYMQKYKEKYGATC